MFSLVSNSRRNPGNVTRRTERRKRRTAFSTEMEKQNAQEDTLTGQTIQPKRAKQKEEKLADRLKSNGLLTFLNVHLRTQL